MSGVILPRVTLGVTWTQPYIYIYIYICIYTPLLKLFSPPWVLSMAASLKYGFIVDDHWITGIRELYILDDVGSYGLTTYATWANARYCYMIEVYTLFNYALLSIVIMLLAATNGHSHWRVSSIVLHGLVTFSRPLRKVFIFYFFWWCLSITPMFVNIC